VTRQDNCFGNYMKDIRESVDLSQKDAAQFLGVPIAIVMAWEHGAILPDENIRNQISAIYKINKNEFEEIISNETCLRRKP